MTSASVPGAVILDVDGTMYVQRPVRFRILHRLIWNTIVHPRPGLDCLLALRAYRRAQETLRIESRPDRHDGREQLQRAADAAGMDIATLRQYVERWMEREPLGIIGRYVRPGLREFLLTARQQGAKVGVFSDYSAKGKLLALGVRELIDVVWSAQDDECGRFKPDPSGLRRVAKELGIDVAKSVYIGDRPDVDGVAAERAGMRAFILSSRPAPRTASWEVVSDFFVLTNTLFPTRF